MSVALSLKGLPWSLTMSSREFDRVRAGRFIVMNDEVRLQSHSVSVGPPWRFLIATKGDAAVIRRDDVEPCLDVHAYLVALCALAAELFPDDHWATVEPRLQRGWERYVAEEDCRWGQVRAAARRRWQAHAPALAVISR